jgi:hypothetical protein
MCKSHKEVHENKNKYIFYKNFKRKNNGIWAESIKDRNLLAIIYKRVIT